MKKRAREVTLAGALVASLAWNFIDQGDPVSRLEAVAEFAAAVNAPGDFNEMQTYGRNIPNSWHKIFQHEIFPDSMVVAMWPLNELVCLIPRPVYELKVYTDRADSTSYDYWWASEVLMQPDVGDTLRWELEYAPKDSLLYWGDWMRGDGCFQISVKPLDTY